MADYYTQFSFEIENVTEEEVAWAVQEYGREDLWDGEDAPDYEFYYFELEVTGEKIWIWADDNGDVNSLADFLEKFINKFRPEAIIWFEWANTCSRLRTDGFGGGCCVVSKEGQHWMNTLNWGGDKEQEILEARKEVDNAQ